MLRFILYLAVFWLSYLSGTRATNQAFTSFGEMNITKCPITYYGQKYEKVFVAFNDSKFAVCFNGLYKPGIKNDCILMSGGAADRGHLTVLTKEIPAGSGVHKLLPNLKNAGECVNVIPLRDSQQSEIEQVELGNFGTQAILAVKTYSGYGNLDVEADAQVNGLTVSKQTFQIAETSRGVITDMSGCRLSGVVYKTNTTIRDPNICSTVTCDVTGVARALSDCGPMERCQGNDSCVLDTMCTVTASTVIDFVGRVHSIPDRCGYTLVKSTSIPHVQILGVFQERRRKDVSFLDHVILQLERQGVEIFLQQGGRAQLNNNVLTLNNTATIVHGVQLSKDQTGVTAKISGSNYTVSVVFDGNTAQIHVTGTSGVPVHGLCGNFEGKFSEERVSKYSATGCDAQHNEAADSTINCNATTKWCNLLWQAPFNVCHKHVSPEPFITACTRTLCSYPAVDGLRCQFLEAYARVCSHQNNITVEGWRSKTSCSFVPQNLCQDRICSAHEFCGEKNNAGETRCFCRAIFASKYKSTNTLGEPIVCRQMTASVTLVGCVLEDKGIDYSLLHLNDQTCKGEMDDLTHMVTFSFDSNSCGTVVTTNNSHIVYKNTIMTHNSSRFSIITHHDRVEIDFSCYYSQPDIKSWGIKLKDSSVVQHLRSGEWNYNLTMTAYTDPERIKRIQSNTEIQLNEKIWVELKTDGLDEKMVVVVTDSCWATDQLSPNGGLRYDLIITGCPNPADQTVKVVGNGLGTANYFSFSMFRFSGKTDSVFLHCKVDLCIRQSDSCTPVCNKEGRTRRSVLSLYDNENPVLITMAWTN
ncbi:alpha-tectorin-like [Aulostomus maculatus]